MAASSIQVPRAELRAAMRELKIACEKHQLAVLTSRDGALTIAVGMAQAVLPVEGRWLGRIAVPSQLLLRLSRRLPMQDPLEITIAAKVMRIGNFELTLASKPPKEPLPEGVDASLVALVSFAWNRPSTHSRIDAKFLARVSMAEHRYEALLEKATRALRPLGVTEEEVAWLARRAVVRCERKLR